MGMAPELAQAIDKAHAAVEQEAQHDLNPGYRQAIWAALGDRGQEQGDRGIGWQRRTLLAIETTQHVLPIWKKARPSDLLPLNVLAEARQVLDQKIDAKQAWKDRGEFWVRCNNIIIEDEKNDVIVSVGFAAVQALTVALQDEQFDPDAIDYEVKNIDMDIEVSDSAFFASAAYANGPVWAEDSNAAKRLEFWVWWLDTAVPAAWNKFS